MHADLVKNCLVKIEDTVAPHKLDDKHIFSGSRVSYETCLAIGNPLVGDFVSELNKELCTSVLSPQDTIYLPVRRSCCHPFLPGAQLTQTHHTPHTLPSLPSLLVRHEQIRLQPSTALTTLSQREM